MRTNIVLDDELLDEAKKVTGIKTKKDLVHEALRVLVQVRRRKRLGDLKGRVRFRPGYDHKKQRA
jgi:Arc/MetJ family transcription regulator